MKIIATIFLTLIALFTGGCSLIFALSRSNEFTTGSYVIWGPGLAISALCIWGLIRLHRKPPAP